MVLVNAQGPFEGQPRLHRSCRSRSSKVPSVIWDSLPTRFQAFLDTSQPSMKVVGRALTESKAETSGAKGAVMVHGGLPVLSGSELW